MAVRQLYRLLFVVTMGVVASSFGPSVACQEPAGGVDLFGKKLKGWSRSGTGKSPWNYGSDGVLRCDAVAESMAYDETLTDGTLTLEWRFVPGTAKTGHKASLTVRAGDGDHQSTINLGEGCGTIATTITTSSDRLRTITDEASKDVAKKIGEWNTIKVKMRGNELTITVNGETLATTNNSTATTGTIALNTAGFPIEFRRVTWKEDK